MWLRRGRGRTGGAEMGKAALVGKPVGAQAPQGPHTSYWASTSPSGAGAPRDNPLLPLRGVLCLSPGGHAGEKRETVEAASSGEWGR